jgi:hypothetical protein
MDGGLFSGREKNLASMHAYIDNLFIRYVLSNFVLTLDEADHATVTYYILLYRHRKVDVIDRKISLV